MGGDTPMLNMRLTVSFQTHDRRARRCFVFLFLGPSRTWPNGPYYFSSGSHFYCHCHLFFCIAPFFSLAGAHSIPPFPTRSYFIAPVLQVFLLPRAVFFPTACSLSLSFFLAPQRKPSSSLVFVFKAYNRVGAVFDLESTLVRGSCRFSFPFYLISSLRN